ncbi:uncharacterized protein LOC135834122 [Planococcus citri]|uniref:uncharacterized protein LOC135834122 n=1 Tax=Planococcus citri TaxID=170843 RepID=UPI0031FA05A9
MFPIAIILCISLGGFSIVKGNEQQLPDNGRLAVGGCLNANFPKYDENQIHIEGVEDYLFVLCDATPNDPFYFEKQLDGIKKKPDQAYDDLKSCLNNHYESNDPNAAFKTSEIDRPIEEIKRTETNKSNKQTDELINRYKQFAITTMKEKANEFHEITQIVLGLCGEHEWVRYKDLDQVNQPKAYNCLRDCAVRLFNIFERLIQEIQTKHKNFQEQQTKNGGSQGNEKQILDQENISQNSDHVDGKVQNEDAENQKEKDSELENKKEAGTSENPTESRDEQSEKGEQNTMKQWFAQLENLLFDTSRYEYAKGIDNYVNSMYLSTFKFSYVNQIEFPQLNVQNY